MRLTFARHGQTPDNAERKWQGWGGRGLGELGIRQARLLGERLAGRRFTRVLTSDIERVVETAAYLGKPVEVDKRWREIHVGSWAGRSIPETWEVHRDVFDALRRGENIRIGGDGESILEFHDRIGVAVGSLIEQHDEGDEVLVISHGGFIGGLVASVFGARWPMGPTAPIHNTALTTFAVRPDRSLRLEVLNDDVHLSSAEMDTADWLRDARTLTFVRHAESNGNVAGTWEGHACSGLSSAGVIQAARLGEWWSNRGPVVSSDTPRAMATASQITNGSPAGADPGLRELHAGSWEGLTFEELEQRSPDLAQRIYQERQDLPRGGDGETWTALAQRLAGTVGRLLADHPGDLTLVSHGSAIRAYLLDAMGMGWEQQGGLGALPNTGLATVLLTTQGPRLRSYGVTPHLEW